MHYTLDFPFLISSNIYYFPSIIIEFELTDVSDTAELETGGSCRASGRLVRAISRRVSITPPRTGVGSAGASALSWRSTGGASSLCDLPCSAASVPRPPSSDGGADGEAGG